MINKEILKKQIIYRSKHRGTKEMDILLGKFTNKYINIFNIKELTELNGLLNIEDEILYNWYFNKMNTKSIPNNKVSKLLKNFKL
tara:strand:+ start:368 stop:622 length:255 start_codon:yes stop_codon:yes gene_type:complete